MVEKWAGPGTVPLALNLPDPETLTGVMSTGAINILVCLRGLVKAYGGLVANWTELGNCRYFADGHRKNIFANFLADDASRKS
jgi:hypothetical protein